MQRSTKAVASVLLAMMATTAAAETKWFNPALAGSNFWSVAKGWVPTAALPTLEDDVGMNNALTTPLNPLVIAEGTEAVCNAIRLADNATANYVGDGRIPSLHIAGGSLHTGILGVSEEISVGHHAKGYGLLTLSGGMISNRTLTVGTSGIGVVTNNGGVVELTGYLYVGLRPTGRGTYVQQSGTFKGGIIVGYDGRGTLIHAGGTITNSGHLYVGQRQGSEGLLDVRAPGWSNQSGRSIMIGYEGRGILEQRSELFADYLKIGGSTNVTSVATIYAGATNLVYLECNIGGYVMPSEKPGNGTLLLKGGVLKISGPSSDTNPNLYVGRLAEGRGRIQGWGVVGPSVPKSTNVRIMNGNGVIQGDGEGEARTLDLLQVVNVVNNQPNGADGTNGWYAVNKGCVLYPRGWFNNAFSTVTCCVGDPRNNTAPDLVNSVCATFTGITSSANFFRGGLYATDREDIPVGLPESKTTVGVWQLGLYRDDIDWNASKAQPFTNVALTFRYDQTRVQSHQTLTLYHHTGGAWARVGGGAVAPAHCISTTAPLDRLSNADANIGWFALVARDSGTVIMVK